MQQVNTDSRVEVSTVSKNITHQTIRQVNEAMHVLIWWFLSQKHSVINSYYIKVEKLKQINNQYISRVV